jgi:hypothetical protein
MALLLESQNQIGKREDLADYVSLVNAHSTPVSSLAKKGSKPGNTVMSWQVTKLDNVTNTGTVDGVDVSAYDHNVRALCQNYVQIYRLATRVSNLSVDVSNVAGVKDELAFQVAHKITELKNMMELSFCSAQAPQADDGSSTPYMTRGLANWISTSAGSVLATPTGFTTPTASIETTATTANITDTTIQDVMSSIFSETGTIDTYDMPVGRTLKRGLTDRLSGIRTAAEGTTTSTPATQVRTFNPQKGRSIEYRVDTFSGDFGEIRLHPSNWLAAQTDGLCLKMSDVEIRYSSLPEVKSLPDAGGGPIRSISAVAALVLRSGPLNQGKFDLAS